MAEKRKNLAVLCLSAAFLLGFFLWSLFLPDAKTSVSERRPLEAFPTLTGETVLSGEFMSSFESYTLDQFPMRDAFRTVKTAAGTDGIDIAGTCGSPEGDGALSVSSAGASWGFPSSEGAGCGAAGWGAVGMMR